MSFYEIPYADGVTFVPRTAQVFRTLMPVR